MQNSDAPSAAVSRAASSTSSVSRNGVALTGVSNAADWLQKWQSSGHPPVLADKIPSTSTSGPHQARRTSWASAASDGTEASGTRASVASSSALSWRRSSSRASSAERMAARASAADNGGSVEAAGAGRGESETGCDVSDMVVDPTEVARRHPNAPAAGWRRAGGPAGSPGGVPGRSLSGVAGSSRSGDHLTSSSITDKS